MKTIFRTKLSANFTVLPNTLLRDERLSFRARGVLTMILSHPGDTEVHKGWIQQRGTEGREAIQSAVNELRALGYASCEPVSENGKWLGQQWTFRDIPVNQQPAEPAPVGDPTLRTSVASGSRATSKKEELTPKKKRAARLPTHVPVPQNLDTPEFQQAWVDWLEDRAKRRKPVTDRAAQLQLRDLSAMGLSLAIEAIENAIECGWQKPYPPRTSNHHGKDNSSRPQNPRNTGIIKGPTDYGNAVARRVAQSQGAMAGEVGGAQSAPSAVAAAQRHGV